MVCTALVDHFCGWYMVTLSLSCYNGTWKYNLLTYIRSVCSYHIYINMNSMLLKKDLFNSGPGLVVVLIFNSQWLTPFSASLTFLRAKTLLQLSETNYQHCDESVHNRNFIILTSTPNDLSHCMKALMTHNQYSSSMISVIELSSWF